MVINIQVLFSMDKDMVKDHIIHTNLNKDTKDNGLMIKNMEKVNFLLLQ